jgi:hypothetical protein
MKSILFVIITSLVSFSAFASTSTCTSAYSVGLGHFFKGEVDIISEDYAKEEVIETGFHKISFVKGNLQVSELGSKHMIEMKDISQDETVQFFISTTRLESHPLTWSGMNWGKPFMMIICSEEN